MKATSAVESPHAKAVLLYDDFCAWCTRMAKTAAAWSRGRVSIVGMHSPRGDILRMHIHEADTNPEDVFWLIKQRTCYGGWRGIVPLMAEVVAGRIH
ncbi:MAG: hypothetical protein ACE5PO_08825 [Candidatus Bathyarchaeia archaeon]